MRRSARAGAAANARGAHAGDLRRERLTDVRHGDLLLHLLHVDDAHRRADLSLLDGAAGPRDDDLIELHGARCQREGNARRVVPGERDRRHLRAKADARHANGVAARADAAHHEGAARVAARREVGPDDLRARGVDRLAGPAIGDRSRSPFRFVASRE